MDDSSSSTTSDEECEDGNEVGGYASEPSVGILDVSLHSYTAYKTILLFIKMPRIAFFFASFVKQK